MPPSISKLISDTAVFMGISSFYCQKGTIHETMTAGKYQTVMAGMKIAAAPIPWMCSTSYRQARQTSSFLQY
jgi:hypothetical protein